MTLHDFPALNATLNATAMALLTAGFIFIKRRNVVAHRACMLAACAVSAALRSGGETNSALARASSRM